MSAYRTFAPTCAALTVLWGALAPAPGRAADAPLCDWLGGIGGAAQAQATGDLSSAVRLARQALVARPRGDAAGRASAALGLALLAEGRPDAALPPLERAAVPEPARPELALRHAEALVATGRVAEAATALAAVTGERELSAGRRARLREGEVLIRAGLTPQGIASLRTALAESPDDPGAPRARLTLAAALHLVKEEGAAVQTLRALWLERPELPEAAEAAATLDRWRAAGAAVPAFSGADHAARAERLLWTGRPADAWQAIARAAQAPPPAAAPERLALLRAQILLARGDAEGAAAAVGPLGESADEGARRGADWVHARIAARQGRVEEASAAYARVAASRAPVPGLSEGRQRDLGDEAGYLSAWLFYDAGRYEEAATRLAAFADANPRSRRADDARWFVGWSLYRLGRGAQAARALALIPRGDLADAALYWRARLAPTAAARRALYAQAIAASDGGWYAILARARLAALGVPAPAAATPEARPLPDAVDEPLARRIAAASALLGLGLRDAALGELDALARTRAVRPAASLVAQLAAYAEDPELPFRMARDYLVPTRRALRWGHPEAFPDLLPARAAAFGVDPALLRAVMRRESNFRREVRSGAGAEGLLQLVRPTADRLTAVLGVPDLAARLGEAEVNVSLGAHYLGLLLGRFRDPAVAVAAYNAGPGPVAAWAAERAGMPLDAWVESIPFRETRAYVKIVLSAWEIYRGLGGAKGAGVDPDRAIPKPGPGVAF